MCNSTLSKNLINLIDVETVQTSMSTLVLVFAGVMLNYTGQISRIKQGSKLYCTRKCVILLRGLIYFKPSQFYPV